MKEEIDQSSFVKRVTFVEAPIFMAASPSSVASSKNKLEQKSSQSIDQANSNREIDFSTTRKDFSQFQNIDYSMETIESKNNSRTQTNSSMPKRNSWPIRVFGFMRRIRYQIWRKTAPVGDHGSPSSKSSVSDQDPPARSSLPTILINESDVQRFAIDLENGRLKSISDRSLNVDGSEEKPRKQSAGSIENLIGAIKRKFSPDPISLSASFPSSESISSRLTEYMINVKTSDRFGAGTDANVFLQLFGDLGKSDAFPLVHSNNVNKFERNQLDRFVFRNASSLGHLNMIKVWHDNTGVGAAWHLEYIEVSDTTLGLLFRFPCHAWLSEHEGLGASRELRCFEVLEGPKKAIQTASGVFKRPHNGSFSDLNTKNIRSGSLPVTPISARRVLKQAPPTLKLHSSSLQQECCAKIVQIDSVFTPSPARPPPVIRFPLLDDSDNNDNDITRFSTPQHASTVPAFSSATLMEATKKNLSTSSQSDNEIAKHFKREIPKKRTVYGTLVKHQSSNEYIKNCVIMETGRYGSSDTLSSQEGTFNFTQPMSV